MLIGSNFKSLGLAVSIKEPDVDREASSYIISHYDELIGIIRHNDIKEEKAQDLLHDVYISIVDAESEGNGFDMEFGNRNSNADDDIKLMDVSQFVIGRIKLYAKNTKYRTDIIEGVPGSINQTNIFFETELDKNGQEIIGKDGCPKLKKVVQHVKVPVTITNNAASFNSSGDITDDNDDFQKAYATSAIADSTDDVAEMMSLRENIEYCISICDTENIKIINVFKNIDLLADLLGEYSKKKKTADSIFSKLTEIAEYHDEFKQTFIDIVRFAGKNRAAFDSVLALY